MLFSRKSANHTEQELISKKLKQKREEIKMRLQQLSDINAELQKTVSETQELAIKVREKVKKMMKVDGKSLTAICKNMNEGIVLVGASGRIIHVNKTAEKLFGVDESSVINSSISSLVSNMDMADAASGETLVLSSTFFSRLSKVIIDHIKLHSCSISCPELHTIEHKFINVVAGETVNVLITCKGKRFQIAFNCTVLDNNPEHLRDITYVFVIKRAKKNQTA